jgi:hypothetical protein
MGLRRPLSHVLTGAAALLLQACVMQTAPQSAPLPEPRAEATEASAESVAFAQYYRNVEARLVSDGLMRVDGGVVDAPFTAAMLATNFERIALFDEYTLSGGRFVRRETPSRLRRWEQPVQLQPHFGRSVSPEQQAADRAVLSTYAGRLSRASGHPIITVAEGGNFHVLYLDRDEQKAAGDLVRRLVPGVGRETISAIEAMPRTTFCAVFAFSEGSGKSVYMAAVAIIRAEHPNLLRRSCVHEEVAQGMGLPNDSAGARPSIFNDDEEFSLLTPHDELLLRILYDRRLSPGMTPDEARPIVRMIAQELVGGSS